MQNTHGISDAWKRVLPKCKIEDKDCVTVRVQMAKEEYHGQQVCDNFMCTGKLLL